MGIFYFFIFWFGCLLFALLCRVGTWQTLRALLGQALLPWMAQVLLESAFPLEDIPSCSLTNS